MVLHPPNPDLPSVAGASPSPCGEGMEEGAVVTKAHRDLSCASGGGPIPQSHLPIQLLRLRLRWAGAQGCHALWHELRNPECPQPSH